jgi:Domain of unknown function (DUF4136)
MRILDPQRAAMAVLWISMSCCAVLSAGCDQVTVRTASNPAASFGRYRTFSFGAPEAPPRGYLASPWSPEVRGRVQALLMATLEQKGYVPAPDKGDLDIQFGSGRRLVHVEKTEPAEGDQSLMQEPHFDYDVVEGSLVVDAFDAATGVRVWHGSSQAEIQADRVNRAVLKASVAELLASFPREAQGIAPRNAGSLP